MNCPNCTTKLIDLRCISVIHYLDYDCIGTCPECENTFRFIIYFIK